MLTNGKYRHVIVLPKEATHKHVHNSALSLEQVEYILTPKSAASSGGSSASWARVWWQQQDGRHVLHLLLGGQILTPIHSMHGLDLGIFF